MVQESLKDVSRVFQWCFKKISKEFNPNFNEVSRRSQETIKGISQNFQFARVLRYSKEISRFLSLYKGRPVFDGFSFQSVLRVFQGSLKKMFKVFQKSFMLHVTHCSYPSRRNPCCFIGTIISAVFPTK